MHLAPCKALLPLFVANYNGGCLYQCPSTSQAWAPPRTPSLARRRNRRKCRRPSENICRTATEHTPVFTAEHIWPTTTNWSVNPSKVCFNDQVLVKFDVNFVNFSRQPGASLPLQLSGKRRVWPCRGTRPTYRSLPLK